MNQNDQNKNLSFSQIVTFCILIFILSRLFFYGEYKFVKHHLITDTVKNLFTMKTLLNDIWRWDSPIYANIALNGYETTYHLGVNAMWFPLWPLMLKLFSLNGYFNIIVVGIILNQILLLGSLILLAKYFLQIGISEKNVKYCLLLLAFAPTNIYFFAGLTEPTFLFLTLLSFYLLDNNKIWSCVFVASLLSALKIVGVSFSLIFLYFHYKQKKINYTTILQSVIIAIPLICYMIYLQIHMGDFLAFLHAQKEPSLKRIGFDFTKNYITQTIFIFKKVTIYDLLAFLTSLFLITGVLWRRKFHKEAIFNFLCIIPVFLSGNLWNSFRYGFCLFTAYLGITVVSKEIGVLKLIILILSTTMTMICITYWLSGSWVFA